MTPFQKNESVAAHRVTAVAAEIRSTSDQPGISSPLAVVPVLGRTTELARAAKVYAFMLHRDGFPIGNPIDDGGGLYWAQQLAAGTSRATVARSLATSTAWRNAQVDEVFSRWILRRPTSAERAKWSTYQQTHTLDQTELAIARTSEARDAGHTGRARHLEAALGTDRWLSYQSQLDKGTTWVDLVNAAYYSTYAIDARIDRIRSGRGQTFDPRATTRATESQIRAALASRDAKQAWIVAASNLV
jgi:hypothetical protein